MKTLYFGFSVSISKPETPEEVSEKPEVQALLPQIFCSVEDNGSKFWKTETRKTSNSTLGYGGPSIKLNFRLVFPFQYRQNAVLTFRVHDADEFERADAEGTLHKPGSVMARLSVSLESLLKCVTVEPSQRVKKIGELDSVSLELEKVKGYFSSKPDSYCPKTYQLGITFLNNDFAEGFKRTIENRLSLDSLCNYSCKHFLVKKRSRSLKAEKEQQHANVLANEMVFESRLTFEIPEMYLTHLHRNLSEKIQKWEKLLLQARVSQRKFVSDAEAAKYGCRKIIVEIISVLNVEFNSYDELKRLSTPTTSGKPQGKGPMKLGEHLRSGISKVDNFINLTSTKAQRMSAKSLLPSTMSGSNSTSRRTSKGFNLFAVLSYMDPITGKPVAIAQTNTEYRTFNATFGQNSTRNQCEHSNPRTRHKAFGYTTLLPDNAFSFYVPGRTSVTLKFEVFHERFSLAKGIQPILLFESELSLRELQKNRKQNISLQLCSPSDQHASGQLQVSVEKVSSQHQLEESLINPNPFLSGWPIHCIDSHINELHGQKKLLSTYISTIMSLKSGETGENSLEVSAIKPSVKKKDANLAPIPTNLHIEFFVVGPAELSRHLDLFDKPMPPPLPARPSSVSQAKKIQNRKGRKSRRPPAPVAPNESDQSKKTGPSVGGGETDHGIYVFTTAGVPSAHSLGMGPADGLLSLNSAVDAMKDKVSIAWSPDHPTLVDEFIRHEYSGGFYEQLIGVARLESRIWMREAVVVSQTLAIVAASFVAECSSRACFTQPKSNFPGFSWLQQLLDNGFLVGWESLVSSKGKELTMLQDIKVGLDVISKYFKIVIERRKGVEPRASCQGVAIAERTITVFLNGNELPSEFNGLDKIGPIAIVPILFTQGINEIQTIANVVSRVGKSTGSALQNNINNDGLKSIKRYWESLVMKLLTLPSCSDISSTWVQNMNTSILKLEEAVSKMQSHNKDVDILICAADVVRSLRGSRITFCKSGKDRTAMSITLEQSRVLHGAKEDIPNGTDTLLKTANLFREYGSRLVIAEKNVGRPLYSFNGIQLQFLPKEYRPPPSTIQDVLLSIKARDS